TANARLVERVQLGLGDTGPDGGDTLGPALGRADSVDHRGVVRPVTGGLHDDVLVEAEVVAQREQLLLGGVAGGVLALRRIWELSAGSEDVAVSVDGSRGQGEAWRGGTGIPVQPPWGLLEPTRGRFALRRLGHASPPWADL